MTLDRDDRDDDRVVPVGYASAGDVEAIRRRKTLRVQNVALASLLLGLVLIAWLVSPPRVRSRPRSPCARNLMIKPLENLASRGFFLRISP